MSCRYARLADGVVGCELRARGGWQELAVLEQLRLAGVPVAAGKDACPVAARGQWTRCPCHRLSSTPTVAPVRL